MSQEPVIVFVCEHGAAKSVVAAAYFNHFAQQMGLNVHAVARGTNPDKELSLEAVQGLTEDGLPIPESSPQKLTEAEMQSAQRVVAFCQIPDEYQQGTTIEYWNDIPPFSENYEKARDAIIKRLHPLLKR
jgi:arsenate reductase (thioredoxin)